MKNRYRFLTVLLMLGLAACNTMQGVGKDVQKVGEKIEDAANRK